ncbi:MAG: hypothetical protein L0211_07955 [Planctomycetaceae bacterium]|nr:hypothetical protein [Planctomycetaceae bacterium]
MWLFDSPIYIVLIGIVLGVFVGIAWTASGRKELLYALIGVGVLTVIMLIAERVVVSDREAIQATLAEIARDVQANDVKRVVGHIAKGSPSIVQKVRSEMPNYDFTECRVTKIHKTDVDASAEPRSAIVEFNVRVDGKFGQGVAEIRGPGVRWIRLQMVREEDGKWRVLDYKHAPPDQFMMAEPLDPDR